MRFVKSTGKALLSYFLERQVKKLLLLNDVKVISVVGSVGKTSTKLAIAKLINTQAKVLWQEGNYNDRLTVPLIFFKAVQPSLYDIVGWYKVYSSNKKILAEKYNYEYVVVELGTDMPDTIKKFAYLNPDLTVVTAISPEHMEYFGTLDAVAKEELSAVSFSKQVLIGESDIDKKYLPKMSKIKTYGESTSDYWVKQSKQKGVFGQELIINTGQQDIKLETTFLGEHGAKIILSAIAVGDMLGLDVKKLAKSTKDLKSFSGRMQVLNGIKNSYILDDSYNASPSAVKTALKTLYQLESNQKIALLGNMNELGDSAKIEHQKIGKLCDPSQLDLVVTLGSDSNKYLADQAEKNGCLVRRTSSPYEAGQIIKKQIQNGALILVKGSQNRVFAEEAIKDILNEPKDEQLLVRQSEYWMNIKEAQFGG